MTSQPSKFEFPESPQVYNGTIDDLHGHAILPVPVGPNLNGETEDFHHYLAVGPSRHGQHNSTVSPLNTLMRRYMIEAGVEAVSERQPPMSTESELFCGVASPRQEGDVAYFERNQGATFFMEVSWLESEVYLNMKRLGLLQPLEAGKEIDTSSHQLDDRDFRMIVEHILFVDEMDEQDGKKARFGRIRKSRDEAYQRRKALTDAIREGGRVAVESREIK